MFIILPFPRVYCFTLFCLISVFFFVCHFEKNTNLVLKYPVFIKTSKNTTKKFTSQESSQNAYCFFNKARKKFDQKV